ncbi:cell envelope biogenesis protein OmpA [Aliidiomarina iranensis]|uniref:Cell envelope biogenesis protein OmpA n=1 Tax=Aliidiomarina iranensis TaxID=1434071 RepID=A0A432VR82_9GAMM|nr:TonB-dependent receptor [Aliidiomarina iranensis]RUO18755.1 cell envelope biogenesis protein OmpA [Aliidiomarina iranensis]
MTKTTKLTRIAAAVALTLGMSGIAIADTSSAMRGQIVGPQGEVVANTRVIIQHVPSGTVTTAETNESGIFTASGLRVGGPYIVIIDSDVYEGKTLEDIFLQLGDAYRLNAQLEERRQNIERITVTGSAINTTSLQAGSSSTWGEQEIRNMPTFDRDLKDVVRQNPLATDLGDDNRSLTVGGNNPRYNSITVDGIGQNDDFGLNSGGYPTNRSPISIDAIEQVSIQSVPFNARYSGFTGARINAVTRSGTNELFGSVFYEYASDDLAGTPDASRYTPNANRPNLDYKEESYGFSVGGPILQDRLFFFLNYEEYKEPTSIAQGPLGSSAVETKNIDPSVIARVQDIAQNVYGVDAGDWNVQPEQKDEKILAKIDWNINNDHRLAFTYQSAEDVAANNTTTGGQTNLNLQSRWYTRTQEMDNFALQVYSNWTNNLNTEFKASVKDVSTGQNPSLGRNFGQVEVRFTEDENPGGDEGQINIGPDRSRHANSLETTTTEIQLHGEYLWNEHQIQFGAEYQNIDVFNEFVQNSLGNFFFDSIEDFENRFASEIQYQNAFTNVAADGAASFEYGNMALYLQDTWDVNWDLTLSFGLRYERFSSSDTPALNSNFVERYGFENTNNMDGLDLLLPRFSFNYEYNDNITIRGGAGMFAGGRPNVWISNAYSNDGVTVVSAPNLSDVSNVDITSVPQEMRDSLAAGDGNTTPIDPNFKMPYDTRYSVAIDYDDLSLGHLGEGWFASAEFIYTDKNREVAWTNLAKVPLLDDSGNQVTSAAGRPLYVSWDPLAGPRPDEIGGSNTSRYDILLTNVSGGRSLISTLSLGNNWDNGLSVRFSYTNQDVKDITSGGSSTAHSNYNFQTAIDKQNPTVGRASYEIEHRFMASLNYSKEFFAGYRSNFSLFWDRTSGRPYSYALDAFRFGGFGDASQNNLWSSTNYLPYIPTGADDPNVRYTGGLTYAQFAEWIESANLEQFAGGYAVRNEGNRGPWNTNLDFRFEQEIPGILDGHKGAIYVDVRNVLAMLGQDNQRHTVSFSDTGVRLASIGIDTETGQYIYGSPFGGFDETPASATRYNARASTWSAKIGVRYQF